MNERTPLQKRPSMLQRGTSALRRGEVMFKDDHIDMDGSLKAAVFGFNDGLCANTCLMIGIASASNIEPNTVIASGLVGLFAGAASMAAGEWISLTLQNRAEAGEIEKERQHIRDHEHIEDANLNEKLREFGFSDETIESIARDMSTAGMDKKVKLHAKIELGLDVDEERGNPIKSMLFMMTAFALGAIVPLFPWVPYWYPGPVLALLLSIFFALLASFVVGLNMSCFTDEPATATAQRQVFAACVAIFSVWAIGFIYSLFGGDAAAAG